MIPFLTRHTLLIVYSVVFAGLAYGVYQTSGTAYMAELMLYYVALVGFYALFSMKPVRGFLERRLRFSAGERWWLNMNYLIIAIGAFVLFHFIYMKGSPALQALQLDYVEDVALLRASITEGQPKIILYLTSFCLKGLLPFILVYLILKQQYRLYWLVLLIAVFYAFSLMQKSYIVGLLIPSLVYCLGTRRFLMALKDFVLIGIVVFSLSVIANPPGGSRSADPVMPEDAAVTQVNYSKSEAIAIGLYNRLLIVPGEMVSGWFAIIPAEKPFLYGDGYRLLAKMRGRPFINYSVELYGIMFPDFVERGLNGTVNVASFMNDYANFGRAGLVLSGFLLALLLVLIEVFFSGDPLMKISLNLFHILLLSSGAITTLLFSGGWGFLILMYYFFLKRQTA